MLSKHSTISIHALREEGDHLRRDNIGDTTDFYPRPPRGGRPQEIEQISSRQDISIHALREEGDHTMDDVKVLHDEFLSTPSARRATTQDRCA